LCQVLGDGNFPAPGLRPQRLQLISRLLLGDRRILLEGRKVVREIVEIQDDPASIQRDEK
jgi:hypothetical protein